MLIIFCAPVYASDIETPRELKQAGWQVHHFVEGTHYTFVKSETSNKSKVIHASSKAAASGLVKKLNVDLTNTPTLSWSWKSERLLQAPKPYVEKSKPGDDYTARLYVIAKGRFFWQTKALNYVWSSQYPVGDSWYNPYTNNAKMIVVESGTLNLGQWLSYSRDIKADFKKYFDINISEINAIAIMTDTDNTQGEAESWYRDIQFSQ